MPKKIVIYQGSVIEGMIQEFSTCPRMVKIRYCQLSACTLTNSTDTRHQLSFRYYETGSPFEYDLVRLLYTKKRELDIAK